MFWLDYMFLSVYSAEQGVSVLAAETLRVLVFQQLLHLLQLTVVYYIKPLNKPVSFMIHSIFSACLLNPCSSPVFRVFRTRRQKSPDIPEISSQEETCQTLASKPTANKHRHLMVSCRQHLPISSRVWTFPPLFHHHAVFIHLWRQPASSEPLSHMWLLSQLQSNGVARRTEAFQKGGKAVFGPNKRSRTADGSSLFGKKNNQWVFFPFSVKLCGAVQVLVLTSLRMVPSSSLSAESYLEETRGRIQPVIDGFFASKKWMSALHEAAQVEQMRLTIGPYVLEFKALFIHWFMQKCRHMLSARKSPSSSPPTASNLRWFLS